MLAFPNRDPGRGWIARRFLKTALLGLAAGCAAGSQNQTSHPADPRLFLNRLALAAEQRAGQSVRYDPAYVRIPYPGGDVPPDTGVCSDEIIRSFRALGIDLQKEVHQDMSRHLSAYPRRWSEPEGRLDTSIDHRRVPNLMVFFSRKGESLRPSQRAEQYVPGEIVTWDLGGNVPHIGLVVTRKSASTGRYLVLHNIGRGPQLEDLLLNWKITGHYRYFGPGEGQPVGSKVEEAISH